MSEQDRDTFLYDLVDPRDNLPFYVGISSEPEVRFLSHLANIDKSKKVARVQEIKAAGLKPILRITEGPLARATAREREMLRIQDLERQGITLTNIVHSSINDGDDWSLPLELLPTTIEGDTLFKMWDLYMHRNRIKPPLTEAALDRFLATIPDDRLAKATYKPVFKVAVLCF